jgi:electron transport complex protein RnfD
MLDVVIALAPAFIASVMIFGANAALITSVCVFSCVMFELLFQKLTKRPVTITDLSAVITGLILAFNLPPGIPIWQAVIGCFVAIILVKQLFGGLGRNFANPAVVARVVMFLAFASTMTTWGHMDDSTVFMWYPGDADAVSSSTPLVYMASNETDKLPSLLDMFIGTRLGSIGETSALALLLGGAYLMVRRVITWHIPVSFMATVAALTFLAGGFDWQFMVYHLLAGGLVIGAVFMATDYVTSPQTWKGRLMFGVGCGLLTVVIRLFGNYPEGVSFAILFMNVLVPFINKLAMTKPLGGKKA